jgi:hypothetical protein
LSSALETIGLWLLGALRAELARLGDLGLGLLSWLEDVDRRALDALANPLVLWLVLLVLLAVHALADRPARPRPRHPIGGVR